MYGNALLGLEADINFADTNDNDNPTSDISRDSGMDWFATMRGRLGYSFGPGLIYATVVSPSRTSSIRGSSPAIRRTAGRISVTPEFGWTVGGGVEFMITESLSVKAEGLFVKFDDASSVNDNGFEMEVEQEAVIERVGLNYHF